MLAGSVNRRNGGAPRQGGGSTAAAATEFALWEINFAAARC
jgi:hypothetical protein